MTDPATLKLIEVLAQAFTEVLATLRQVACDRWQEVETEDEPEGVELEPLIGFDLEPPEWGREDEIISDPELPDTDDPV